MVIYLKHPIYGTKVASMELEAVADEKNGWVRFDPRQLELDLPDEVPLNPAPVENALAGRGRRRVEVVQ